MKDLFKFLEGETRLYYAPINLTYFWCFGYLLLIYFVLQVVSGIILAMWYTPHVNMAFDSISFIMGEVEQGWLLRYFHVNAVSFIFGCMYIHIFRGLFFGSYGFPRISLWLSGLAIFMMMIVTAFLGYVLPWGQMSYWGATVITSFLSVIPFFGKDIQIFVWGAYFIDQPALGKFFSLHYLFPFLIIGLIVIHLFYLHKVSSNNPLNMETNNRIPLYPYYIWKDGTIFLFSLFFFFLFVFFMPDFLNHPDNSIMANPSVTPEHIVPEWYFLLFYAVLRSVPNKEMGVILMVMSILFLIFFIFILKVLAGNLPVTITTLFRGGFAFILWFFVSICVLLLILGGLPVATPFLESAQLFTLFYFLQLSFLIPVSVWFSNLPLLKEIIGNKIIAIEDRILEYIEERSKL